MNLLNQMEEVMRLLFLLPERSKAMIGARDTIKKGAVNDVFYDSSADIQDLEQYGRDNNFSMGSSCYCIGTGELYMMLSDFSWKKQ